MENTLSPTSGYHLRYLSTSYCQKSSNIMENAFTPSEQLLNNPSNSKLSSFVFISPSHSCLRYRFDRGVGRPPGETSVCRRRRICSVRRANPSRLLLAYHHLVGTSTKHSRWSSVSTNTNRYQTKIY